MVTLYYCIKSLLKLWMEVENMQIGQSIMSLSRMRSKTCFLFPVEITMSSSNYSCLSLLQRLKGIMLFTLAQLLPLEMRSDSVGIRLLLESYQHILVKQLALSLMELNVLRKRIWEKLSSVFHLMLTRKIPIEIAQVLMHIQGISSSLELLELLKMLASPWLSLLQLWQSNSSLLLIS